LQYNKFRIDILERKIKRRYLIEIPTFTD